MIKHIITVICGFTCLGTLLALHNENTLERDNDQHLDLSWGETKHSLSLLNGGEIIWQLNYDKSEDKPYFYPLRTPDGVDLALERPDDHPWHRGLWFSWKSINGLNYWEEDPDTGLSPGRTIIKKVQTDLNEDYSASITFDIAYGPDERDPIMHEERVLNISAPNEHGNYTIDWSLRFKALQNDLVLDREVPAKHGGVIWGGYAGLGYRADDTELTSIRYLDSNRWSNTDNLTGYGKDANWMDLSGIAPDENEKSAGLTIFDHPENPRHPSPWYIWYEEGKHAFYMPAFLYNKPYRLGAKDSFSLKYRVLVHSGKGQFKELNLVYRDYTK